MLAYMIDRSRPPRLFSATMKFRSLLAFLTLATCLPAAPATPSPWGNFVEKDFPFFSSVLDARDVGEGFPKDNLTPRGLILNLGNNVWACFDTDLLRIACIWEGEEGKPPVSPEALAPGSYHVAGQKTKDGQDFLPKPIGKVRLANGIYPDWQAGEKPSFTDPREPTPSVEEVGRGPVPASLGIFRSVEMSQSGDLGVLNLSIGGTRVQEGIWVEPPGRDKTHVLMRSLEIGAHEKPISFVVCSSTKPLSKNVGDGYAIISSSANPLDSIEIRSKPGWETKINASIVEKNGLQIAYVTVPPTADRQIIYVATGLKASLQPSASKARSKPALWPQTLTTKATLSTKPDAYVIDDIPLPLDNPWKRNVRLADIAFLNDQGDAAGVTFDGDVWLISGLKGDLEKVTWKRYASGLHEPMSIVVRKGQEAEILVFDRTGIWKLVDTNGDKECDRYEMFCNLFGQTAETREFPNSMKLGPKGELYISKGGQEGTTYGKHNGTVIKIAPDGKSMEVIGYGLRQPFIGVNPKTGLVTASDQQGNYVPSTPLHIISDHHFYGHVPTIAPKEKYPETITEPLTWLPHPVNPSGVTQTWLLDAKMGPVNGELIHIGYNRPELFRVLMNSHFEKPQAAVVSFSRNFDFPTLNAVVNPADGQLYVVGFQVWGTVVKRISGLARVRYTDKPRVLLKEVTPTDKGLLLRFNAKLDAKLANDPDSFNGERWNYKRTFDYGSPHLKPDGSSGQEWMTPSSAYLSNDGMSVLVGFPDMKAGVHQMRIGWGLKSVDGAKAENTAYFSPWELLTFDAKKEGFEENLKVDLTPRKAAAVAAVKATAEEGERLYQMYGCMACHSIDGTLVGKVGPSWKGLFGSEREIAKGQKGKFKANEVYLRESITNPSAKVVKGFEKFDTGMPIYAGILNESQIESLILYIKSLK
jgi:cytochrome c551/c552/glucose/arabinose dehydrogenase